MKQDYFKSVIDIIIFILIILILQFNLVSSNMYLKNLIFMIVIGYFGMVDLKFALIIFIIYILDLEYRDSIYLDNLYKENFMNYKGILESVQNNIKENKYYKSIKKGIKEKGRELFKSIQEEDLEILPEKKKTNENEYEGENEDDEETENEKEGDEETENESEKEDENSINKKINKNKKKIENFSNKENFEVNENLKKNIESNYLIKQLKKNDLIDKNLENFQGSIENKLEKINILLKKIKK
jgi:hypothetical protein